MIRLEPSYEQLEHRRRRRRFLLLILALLLCAAGYALLAVSPDTPWPMAVQRAFLGLGLLLGGFLVFILSRLIP